MIGIAQGGSGNRYLNPCFLFLEEYGEFLQNHTFMYRNADIPVPTNQTT